MQSLDLPPFFVFPYRAVFACSKSHFVRYMSFASVRPPQILYLKSLTHHAIVWILIGLIGAYDSMTEMSYQMQNTGARAVLVYPTLLETARKASKEAGLPEDRLFIFSDTEHKPVEGIKDWRSMLGSTEEASNYNWPRLSPSESRKTIATINYSSGTTGVPKGVMITHSNLIANTEQGNFIKNVENPEFKRTGTYEHSKRQRWIGFLPLYHAFGQQSSILMASRLSVPVYIMTKFVFEDFLRTIQTHKITNINLAPPILVMMSKNPATANYDLSSIKQIFSGAAPLSKSLQNECRSRFNLCIGQGWGMTEMVCGGLVVPEGIEDSTGSVGTLMPNNEVKMCDESGKEVATGERGEILLRGPSVCLGYWKNEKATRETILEGGWLRTGDVAVSDDRAWFWIVDRLKVGHWPQPSSPHKLRLYSLVASGTYQSLRPPSRPRRT